jgi:hypothetical protein
MDDACVDCYDEHDQFTGLFTMIDQELAFPLPARVLGEHVEVTSATTADYDSLGIDLVVVHKGKEYSIAAHSIELETPLPDGDLYLAAYLEWKSKQ